MKVDLEQMIKKDCSCGRNHDLSVKGIWIEKQALNRIPLLLNREYQYPVILCDENTYDAAGRRISELLPNSDLIILKAMNLHADNNGTKLALMELKEQHDIILAVGSGTIHDISRYIAHKKHIPFVSVPTAASVDGFVSTVSAMTWDGMKKTMPGIAPIYVVADTDVFTKAPYRLTASGISDLLGKYTAIVDWKISHLVTGEEICNFICNLENQALLEVCQNLNHLKEGDEEAYEKLMYALLLSGLAMQMWGNSRPASGAEHHISHLWEMELLNNTLDAYHGEKVSVGLLMTVQIYHYVKKQIEEDSCRVIPYEGLELSLLNRYCEPKGLLQNILTENNPDPLEEVDPIRFQEMLTAVSSVLNELPSVEEIEEMLTKSGCMKFMTEAGLSEDLKELTLRLSPYVRNRLTFMRLLKMLEPNMIENYGK